MPVAAATTTSFSASAFTSGSSAGERIFKPFGHDGLSFFDILDVVNPLQHLPGISSLYRELTGDIIDPAARIAGGALFGGPMGAIGSAANVLLKAATGKDAGKLILDLVDEEEAPAVPLDTAPASDISGVFQEDPTIPLEPPPPAQSASAVLDLHRVKSRPVDAATLRVRGLTMAPGHGGQEAAIAMDGWYAKCLLRTIDDQARDRRYATRPGRSIDIVG